MVKNTDNHIVEDARCCECNGVLLSQGVNGVCMGYWCVNEECKLLGIVVQMWKRAE